jgi:hypothetical protein
MPHRFRHTLTCFGRLRDTNLACFYAGLFALLGGFALAVVRVERAGMYLAIFGGVSLGLLMIETYVVLPFLMCPRCGCPFFLPRGWRGMLCRVDPHRRSCFHCGLQIGGDERKAPDTESRLDIRDRDGG